MGAADRPGGSEQMLARLIADAVGVDPNRVNYIAFAGAGEIDACHSGGQVSVGLSPLSTSCLLTSTRVPSACSASRVPNACRHSTHRLCANKEWMSNSRPGAPCRSPWRLRRGPTASRQSGRSDGASRWLAGGSRPLSVERSVSRPARRSSAFSKPTKRACGRLSANSDGGETEASAAPGAYPLWCSLGWCR